MQPLGGGGRENMLRAMLFGALKIIIYQILGGHRVFSEEVL